MKKTFKLGGLTALLLLTDMAMAAAGTWRCDDLRSTPDSVTSSVVGSVCAFECGQIARQQTNTLTEGKALTRQCVQNSSVETVDIPASGTCPAGFAKRKTLCGRLVTR